MYSLRSRSITLRDVSRSTKQTRGGRRKRHISVEYENLFETVHENLPDCLHHERNQGSETTVSISHSTADGLKSENTDHQVLDAESQKKVCLTSSPITHASQIEPTAPLTKHEPLNGPAPPLTEYESPVGPIAPMMKCEPPVDYGGPVVPPTVWQPSMAPLFMWQPSFGNVASFVNCEPPVGPSGPMAPFNMHVPVRPTAPLGTSSGPMGPLTVMDAPVRLTAPLETSVRLTAPLSTSMGPTGPLSTSMGPTGPLSTSVGPTGPLSTSMGSTGPLSTSMGPTGPLSTSMGPTGPLSTSMGPTGPLSTSMGPTGPLSTSMGPMGQLSTFETPVKPTSPSSTSRKPTKRSKKKAQSAESSESKSGDSSEPKWEPPLWREQLDNIKKMRAARDAPVDTVGAASLPDRTAPPAVYRFQVLVSLMLTSQTKDTTTAMAMRKLQKRGLTLENILAMPQEELEKLIRQVGFWKKKADYIKRTSAILVEKYNGDIPDTFQGLTSLPGVGPKMAHLVMDVAWNSVTGIAVDTHVHRISHRLGWMRKPTKNPEITRAAIEDWLPRPEWRDLNWCLVGFGQQHCLPIGPKCSSCLNKDICPASSTKVTKEEKQGDNELRNQEEKNVPSS